MRWLSLLVIALSSIAMLSACGGDDEKSPEELNQQFCDDLDAFRDSLTDWGSLSINSSLDDLDAKRDASVEAFDQLRESAAAAREPQIDELQQSWDELRRTVTDIDDGTSLRDAISDILNAASGVTDDLGAVADANTC
jgi:hypothetical protein